MIIIFVFILFCVINSKDENNDVNNYDIHIDWNNKKNVEFKNDNKYNISEKVKTKHKYKQFSFSDMNIYTQDGMCHINFKITNNSYNNNIDNYVLFLLFYDDENNLIFNYEYLIPSLNIGESKEEDIEVFKDVSNSYDYKVDGFIEK